MYVSIQSTPHHKFPPHHTLMDDIYVHTHRQTHAQTHTHTHAERERERERRAPTQPREPRQGQHQPSECVHSRISQRDSRPTPEKAHQTKSSHSHAHARQKNTDNQTRRPPARVDRKLTSPSPCVDIGCMHVCTCVKRGDTRPTPIERDECSWCVSKDSHRKPRHEKGRGSR